jgi:hypothetical protein
MARKSSHKAATSETPPTLSTRQGLELLRRQREKGEQLLAKRPLSSDDNVAWKTATQDVLVQTYGSVSGNVSSFENAGRSFSFGGGNEREWEQGRAERMRRQLTILQELIDILEIQVGPEWVGQDPAHPTQGAPKSVSFHNCTFPGDVSMAKQEVNIGGSVNVGGHFVVADSIRNSFNMLNQSKVGPEVQQMIRQLAEAIVEMSKCLPTDKQEEVAQDFSTLATEAAKDTPRKSYMKLAAEGLLAVATTAGNVAVTGLIGALLQHWGIG